MNRPLVDRPAARLAAFAVALAATFGAGWGLGELTHDDRGIEPAPTSPAGGDHGDGDHR